MPKKVINLYISYILNHNEEIQTHFLFSNCLFGSVKLTKNTDLDKYKYSDYSVEFDSCAEFNLQLEAWEKMSLFLEVI